MIGLGLAINKAGLPSFFVQLLTVEGAPIQTVESADIIVRNQAHG